MPFLARGKPRPTGRAVLDVFHFDHAHALIATGKTSRGAPPGSAMRSVAPATRQAAGGGPEGLCRENREQRQRPGQRQHPGQRPRQRQMLSRVGGKEASIGVPGPALCRIDPSARGALRTMPYRAPTGSAMRSVAPATRQAAGVPSAGSQPFQFTTRATPPMGRRRAAEGGPEGRCRENRGSGSGRGSGSIRDSGRDSVRCCPESEGKKRPSGCRVRHCAGIPLRFAPRFAQCRTGLGAWLSFRREKVPGTAPIAFLQALAGRRRTIGVVAALSTRARPASESGRRREARTALTAARREWVAVRKAHQQSTHARPRRWCDAGPPGRQSVTAAQKAVMGAPFPGSGSGSGS